MPVVPLIQWCAALKLKTAFDQHGTTFLAALQNYVIMLPDTASAQERIEAAAALDALHSLLGSSPALPSPALPDTA